MKRPSDEVPALRAADEIPGAEVVVDDQVLGVGRDDDVPPGAGRHREGSRGVVEVTDEGADATEGSASGAGLEGHGDVAVDVLEDVTALIVEAERSRCTGKADVLEVAEERIDGGRPRAGRSANGVADADDAVADVASGERELGVVAVHALIVPYGGSASLVHMSTPAEVGLQRWHEAVERRDRARLSGLIAEHAVFRSPAVHTPQEGRTLVAAYLAGALVVLGPGLTYHDEWVREHDAVLRFTTEVDGLEVEGVDLITWDDDGQITDFTVMIRPLKALNAVVARMAEELARRAG
jgi:hypothetical protein